MADKVSNDIDLMIARAKTLTARAGINEAELNALHLGPGGKYLILVPILERLLDRIEALEKRDGQ